jgi:predicted nucleic acid-binding protein
MSKKYAKLLTDVVESIARDGGAISVVAYGELLEGVLFSTRGQPALNRQRLVQFLEPFDMLAVTEDIAEIWASVRGTLRARGLTTHDNDLMIAATALRFDMTVVTFNRKHFERVEGLSLLVPDHPKVAV